jgi:hypothetical protein
MEPEGSLPCSQEPSTGPYSARSIQSIPSHPISLFFRLGRLSKESVQIRGFLNIFVTSSFLRWEIVSPTPKPQAEGPHLACCPQLLIQYIRSYPPYLEGVSSIRNLRTRHAVVTRDPPNMVY